MCGLFLDWVKLAFVYFYIVIYFMYNLFLNVNQISWTCIDSKGKFGSDGVSPQRTEMVMFSCNSISCPV